MAADSLPCVQLEDQEEEPLRILLLGKSGAGKSSSGNTILGRQEFTSSMSVQRVTRHCEKGVGTVEDVPVAVIDTPGFFERERKDEIVREILMRVKLQEPGPHAFVYVIPVGRMTQEDQDTQELIEEKFGPRVWDYTIVLFTYGDRLGDKSINEVISKSDQNFRNFIRKCSGGFHVFNNKDQQDQKQVTGLIEKIQILVALNGGGYYRTDLYPEEERKIREIQMSILTERDDEIKGKERQLEENYQGERLKMKRRKLWMEEEKQARKTAEEKTKKITRSFWGIFKVLLTLLVIFLAMAICFGPEESINNEELAKRRRA